MVKIETSDGQVYVAQTATVDEERRALRGRLDQFQNMLVQHAREANQTEGKVHACQLEVHRLRSDFYEHRQTVFVPDTGR